MNTIDISTEVYAHYTYIHTHIDTKGKQLIQYTSIQATWSNHIKRSFPVRNVTQDFRLQKKISNEKKNTVRTENLQIREGTRHLRHNQPKKNKTQKKIVFKKKSAFKKNAKKEKICQKETLTNEGGHMRLLP